MGKISNEIFEAYLRVASSSFFILLSPIKMKRTREDSACLTFITACDDGWVIGKRVDVGSAKDPAVLENLMEHVFVTRYGEKRDKDWDYGRYRLTRELMAWIGNEVMFPSDESAPLVDLDLGEMDPIEGFPHDWTRKDWGEWEGFEANDIVVTNGKHYHYVSWW